MTKPRSHGNKLGQGFGRTLPKRALCPNCGKKGVKQREWVVIYFMRECQYCRKSWHADDFARYVLTGSFSS